MQLHSQQETRTTKFKRSLGFVQIVTEKIFEKGSQFLNYFSFLNVFSIFHKKIPLLIVKLFSETWGKE